jgi:hypothetical protein
MCGAPLSQLRSRANRYPDLGAVEVMLRAVGAADLGHPVVPVVRLVMAVT